MQFNYGPKMGKNSLDPACYISGNSNNFGDGLSVAHFSEKCLAMNRYLRQIYLRTILFDYNSIYYLKCDLNPVLDVICVKRKVKKHLFYK